ncbi:hypothetical protein VDG1235_11 [Verrucomicrobiia bacterium DG1235]|nr:hypothetical protein VDG1235_11 [Verrucomicrobiae bacterium DG1235]
MSEEKEFDANLNWMGTTYLFASALVPVFLIETQLELTEWIHWSIETKWLPVMFAGWAIYGLSIGHIKPLAKLVAKKQRKV